MAVNVFCCRRTTALQHVEVIYIKWFDCAHVSISLTRITLKTAPQRLQENKQTPDYTESFWILMSCFSSKPNSSLKLEKVPEMKTKT